MALTATFRHSQAARYRGPGGPWDVPPLDRALPSGIDDPGVAAVAGGLRARGVRRGAVVAWQLPNGDDAWRLYRACWRIGAVAAPVHHQAGPGDVEAMLAQVDPALVISDAHDVPRGEPVGPGAVALRPSAVATVLFTSGSTGTPKAVLHTHRGLAGKARLMTAVHGLGPADAILMPAPLAHISGLLNGVLLPGASGMRPVFMARWDPERALRLIEEEHITFMIGPPPFFTDLIHAPGFSPARVRSLRLVSSGGAGVTPAFVDHATEALGCTVKRTYGSTEAPTVTTSHAGDPPERARDTDGRATGDVELRLGVGGEHRHEAFGAGAGELWLRGPELFVGYADPRQTRAAHGRGGWFRTGDLATIDDGWLTITGRIKDVIIRGGENIAAAEVERVLEAHPHVRQAVAVGAPDERLGERVVAFVTSSHPFDLADCRKWFESRGVTRFKWPEQVVSLESMPTMAAGKPDRAALQARAASR